MNDRLLRHPSTAFAALTGLSEEEIWLAQQKSAHTRAAYRLDVQHFMRTLRITFEELRQANREAVISWERHMREVDQVSPSTIRRRLVALSSLFKHLADKNLVPLNPVTDVMHLAHKHESTVPGFSKPRKLLDMLSAETLLTLRDRAILSLKLQLGLRCAEIAALLVSDLHQNRESNSLRVTRKGGRHDALVINQQTAQQLRTYLEAAGHADNSKGPLFRPLRRYSKTHDALRSDAIARIVLKHARASRAVEAFQG